MRTFFLCALCLMTRLYSGLSQETTILFDQGSYGFDYSELTDIKWRYDRTYQIVIFKDEDQQLLRNVTIELNRHDGDELVNALAMVKHLDGRTDSLTQDSFKLQPFDAVYAEYICRLTDFGIGDTIEIHYSIKSKPNADIVRWDIQHAYPVKSSTFQFIVPVGCIYHDHLTQSTYLFKEEVLDTTFVIERSRIPSKGLRLTFTEIPAYVEEPFAPDLNEIRPAVLFAISDLVLGNVEVYMPSWTDQVTDLVIGDYFGKQYRIRPNFKWLGDLAADILNTRYTDRLMTFRLYEFVHRQFSWDGTYGIIPSHTLQEMGESRSVNKASINMALLALLQEAGLRAYPVLVSTIDQPLVYREIPNLNQFNHFVIVVEDEKDLIYLDAGDPLLPTGLIDNGVRHSNAILIKNYKGTWTEIPDFEAKSTILVDMHVYRDLSSTGTISASFEGYDAQNERHYLAADPQARYWKERGEAVSSFIRIDSVRFENVHNLLQPFINKVYFHIDPSDDHEELAFHPVFYSFFNQPYFTDTSRVNKVVFPSLLKERVIFNLTLDEELQIKSIPEELRLKMIDNSSEMEFLQSHQNNRAQCTFNIEVSKKTIAPEFYEALRTYFLQLNNKLSERVVVSRK